MGKSVFIMGAGTSKEAGVPLMAEFLNVADDIRRYEQPIDKEAFDLVFRGIYALRGTYAKSSIDTNNLETVFTAFEMGAILGKLGTPGILAPEEIQKLPSSMRRLIQITIQKRTLFPYQQTSPQSNGKINPPNAHRQFRDMLFRFTKPKHSVSIITFNYDLALDYAFHVAHANNAFSYCLEEDNDPQKIPVLKLHGSVNWGSCSDENCGRITAIPFSALVRRDEYIDPPPFVTLNIHETFAQFRCSACQKPLAPEPFIVPPTWDKTRYQRTLAHIWQKASKELEQADNIFILGYSLPDTDFFFRLLYAIGTAGENGLRRVWVFNPALERKPAFDSLVGPSVTNYRYIDEKSERGCSLFRSSGPNCYTYIADNIEDLSPA